MTGADWPDVVIAMILAIGAIKGFSRGFVAELGGLAAVAAALIVPWYYKGSADAQIESLTKLAPGPAHVAGMILTGAVAYIVVIVLASILGRIAKLPLLGTGNAIAGALAGALKGALLVWIVLFVALLFPLTPPIRTALHQSRLVPYFTEFDAAIDVALARAVPSFARPLFGPLLDQRRR